LTLACERSARLVLGKWKSDREWHQAPLRLTQPKLTLVPDASFTLKTTSGGSFACFVELDRGSISGSRMRPRLAGYLALPHAPNGRPIPVWVVVPDAERQEVVARWAQEEAH